MVFSMLIRCAVVAAVFAAAPAFAQSEDEIIVTAPKRGESVAQDLPMALNAFGAEELRARNVEDLQSLSYAMPNVQLEDIATARGIANFGRSSGRLVRRRLLLWDQCGFDH
jgi:iron complex outermembrane receptor protein